MLYHSKFIWEKVASVIDRHPITADRFIEGVSIHSIGWIFSKWANRTMQV